MGIIFITLRFGTHSFLKTHVQRRKNKISFPLPSPPVKSCYFFKWAGKTFFLQLSLNKTAVLEKIQKKKTNKQIEDTFLRTPVHPLRGFLCLRFSRRKQSDFLFSFLFFWFVIYLFTLFFLLAKTTQKKQKNSLFLLDLLCWKNKQKKKNTQTQYNNNIGIEILEM